MSRVRLRDVHDVGVNADRFFCVTSTAARVPITRTVASPIGASGTRRRPVLPGKKFTPKLYPSSKICAPMRKLCRQLSIAAFAIAILAVMLFGTLIPGVRAAGFTPGNLVVYRAGDGSAALGG